MWFRKDKRHSKGGFVETSNTPHLQITQEMMDKAKRKRDSAYKEMRAFAAPGDVLTHCGVTLWVIRFKPGHTRKEWTPMGDRTKFVPAILCHYADGKGQIQEFHITHEMLPALREQNLMEPEGDNQ